MSSRGLPKGTRICWLHQREGEGPAEAIRRIFVVGKPSTISGSNALGSISFLAKWSSRVGVLHRVGSLPSPPRQDVHLHRLLCASQSRSAVLRLLGRHWNTTVVRSTYIPFGCSDFSRSVCNTPLTRDSSRRNMFPTRAGSKRPALSKSPNGPVAGLSPENVEVGLTVCKSRSTVRNLRAKGWSVSRPHSAIHIFQLRSMKP